MLYYFQMQISLLIVLVILFSVLTLWSIIIIIILLIYQVYKYEMTIWETDGAPMQYEV